MTWAMIRIFFKQRERRIYILIIILHGWIFLKKTMEADSTCRLCVIILCMQNGTMQEPLGKQHFPVQRGDWQWYRKQLRCSSCSSSQSASSSSHGTVWGSHIHLRISHGPRPPRHFTSSKVQLSLTVCAGAQLSFSGEFCSGEDSLPQLRSGPIHVLRRLRRSLTGGKIEGKKQM